MRQVFLAGWLLLPVGAWAFHEGPGQDLLQLDTVTDAFAQARAAEADQDWQTALDLYREAQEALPDQDRLPREAADYAARIRLATNRVKLNLKGLPEVHSDMADMVSELANDPAADPEILMEARRTHAQSRYYMAWLMRLEGLRREQWEPEIEAARQTYRLLAEQADAKNDSAGALERRKDLEAAVKLARMDLDELQGLKIPVP